MNFRRCSANVSLAVSLSLAIGCGAAAFAGERPNVIVILTDDQGWGDLSLHGNPNLSTPNIDSLARDGAQIANFYVCAVCSPTRAEFLTGRYHTRAGVFSTSEGGERFHADERTIAQAFSQAGYRTAAFGKWHSGTQPPYHPNARGFDEFYGFCSGHWGNYFSPMLEHNGEIVRGDGYLPDDLTDHAIEVITASSEQPFFIYLPLNTPHSPMQVPDADWARFADRPMVPDPEPANRKKQDLDHTRAAMAMCENIDANVGRLIDAVDQQGVAPNTIIVFFCDNGPNGARYNGGLRGRKGSVTEGGLRSPCLWRYPDRIAAGSTVRAISGAIDLFPTLAELADVAIGPTRGPLDGISIARQLTGQTEEIPRRLIFTSWNGAQSVRSQRWRYLGNGSLHDIDADPRELTNVAADHPAVAARLARQLDRWTGETKPQTSRGGVFDPFTVGHRQFATTQLPARDASPTGRIRRSNQFPNCTYMTNWTSTDDAIVWDVDVLAAGTFDASIFYACPDSSIGTRLNLTQIRGVESTDSATATVVKSQTGGFLNAAADRSTRQEGFDQAWAEMPLGQIRLSAGESQLRLRGESIMGTGIDFRLLMLRRIENGGDQ